MSDKAYENAMKRRPDVQAEIAEAEKRLSLLRGELRDIDNFLELWVHFAGEEGSQNMPSPEPHRRRNSKKEEVAEAARQILQQEGQPLSRSSLYNRLLDRGLVIEGSDPQMVLSTMLWRMKDKIVRLTSGGYWIAGVPHKESHYLADREIDDMLSSVDDTYSDIDKTLAE